MKTKIITLLLICAAVCSCASLGKYKPVTEVSDTLYGDAFAVCGEDSLSVASTSWETFFSDTLLQNLIRSAIEGNKDLMIASERIEDAKAELVGAKMGFAPTIDINPEYRLSGGSSQLSLPAIASWQLGIFRKINNLKAAKTGALLMEDYRQAVLCELVANVANLYYTLLMLDSQIETASAMECNWNQSLEMVRCLKEAGLADQVAVSQYEANYEKFKVAVMELAYQIKVCENSMSILMGKEVGQTIERTSLIDQNVPENLSTGLPVRLLVLRPDVRSAEREIELAYYAKRGALLNFFPTLSITGAIGLGGSGDMGLLSEVSAGLLAPVFSAGANRTAYKKAESARLQAKINFDKTLLEAGREVNDAMAEYKTRTEMASNYESLVKSLDQAREDTEYLMKNSLDKTYLDVLYANTTYYEAKLSLIENKARRLQAAVALYSALGGGAL